MLYWVRTVQKIHTHTHTLTVCKLKKTCTYYINWISYRLNLKVKSVLWCCVTLLRWEHGRVISFLLATNSYAMSRNKSSIIFSVHMSFILKPEKVIILMSNTDIVKSDTLSDIWIWDFKIVCEFIVIIFASSELTIWRRSYSW